VTPFAFARAPRILFGPGRISEAARIAAAYGTRVLVITGGRSLEASGRLSLLVDQLSGAGVVALRATVTGEPSPECVDDIVSRFANAAVDAVLAVGGGSVLDAGKAVAAMLPLKEPVTPYLEGVGAKAHPGAKCPMIAVPTTAGTGTEATKNASLRRLGNQGFKNSLRHDAFVPDVAVIDPELALTCPPAVTAACGMDALAQLLESYVSPQASPLTDLLAEHGLAEAGRNLITVFEEGQDLEARCGMAYAALLSGITLANAGLGVVHSLSSAIGGFFDIPHGVICGTLLAPGMRANIAKLRRLKQAESLAKHARAWVALSGHHHDRDDEDCDALIDLLEAWAREMALPRLGAYGVREDDLEKILDKAALRNNPVQLERAEIRGMLLERL